MSGRRLVLSAWGAGECNRVLKQELTEEEERLHAALARMAPGRELDPWKQFEVLSPVKTSSRQKGVADTRWVLAWKEVEDAQPVKA